MSRVPKWKTEKTKVKVVFRLQFHATHIPQPGWDKLFVSFIPADSGKVTAKTNKGSVRNGSCKWSDPIYETTRLLLDAKSKKYEEKLYKLVVAMGSSRSSILGEANINLAEFADALKPSVAALPLQGCDFGTVLHVTVQLLTSKTGFREFEQQREVSVKGLQTMSNQRSDDHGEAAADSLEIGYDQINKVNVKARFKDDSVGLPSLAEVGEPNEECQDFTGVDVSSYTSDSLYEEKHDASSRNEVDGFKSTNSGDIGSFSINQSPRVDKGDQRGSRLPTQGSIDWTHGWSSDYSGDNDLATAYEENNRLRVRLEVAESAFLQLKLEAKSLQRITNELGAETQSLAQQLLVELASGEQLVTEVSMLKSECSKLRNDLEAINSAKITQQNLDPRTLFPSVMRNDILDDPVVTKLGDNVLVADVNNIVHGLKEKWLQDLLLIDGKFQEIQKKTCLAYHGSDFNFVRHDFEVLGCVIEKLKGAIIQGQWLERSYSCYSNQDGTTGYAFGSHKAYDHEVIKKNLEASNMEEKVFDLLHKLEDSKTEKEGLTKKMDQMECYYEALVLELEESQKQSLSELENLKNEHSSCLYTISVLQAQIDKMHEGMNKQSKLFSDERTTLESQNKELEKRAIASEAALKRVRSNYCVAVDRLQKDLELLSFQVLSMYESNENLAKKTFTDDHQLPEEPNDFVMANGDGLKKIMANRDMNDMLGTLEWNKYGSTAVQSEYSPNGTKDEEYTAANGLSEDVCSKNSTGVSLTGVPYDTELHASNDTYADDFKLNITGQEASCYTQAKKNYKHNTDSSLETHVDHELQKTYALHNRKTDMHQLVDANCSHKMVIPAQITEQNCPTLEVELSEMHTLNMNLKVFSEVLQETLLDVNDGARKMKGMILELTQQLEDTTDIKQSLTLRLHRTLDDVKVLREDNAKYISKYEDMSLEKQIFEAKLHDISDENSFLTEKLDECEKLIVKCRAYEDKYNSCIEENNKYENLLKQERLRYSCLQADMSVINEELKALKEELTKKTSANDSLQSDVANLVEKLKYLCYSVLSCNDQLHCSALNGESLLQDLENEEYNNVFMSLKQFQQDACQRLLQISLEKKDLEETRDAAQSALNRTGFQISAMKQKYESELEETMKKLDSSNDLVEKLGLELQTVSKKLKVNLETEKNNALRNEELSSKVRTLEIELQQAVDENKNLVKQLLALEVVKEELEKTQINLVNCKEENETLSISMKSRTEASMQMENELLDLKGKLRCSDEVMQTEKTLRKQLEAAVAELTSQVEEKDQELLLLHKKKAELDHLHGTIMNLEKANNELENLFMQSKGMQKKLEDELLNLKESSRCTNDVMQTEKTLRKQHEKAVANLTSQLEEKNQELLLLLKQKAEADHLHGTIMNLENTNNELENLFSQSKERQKKLEDENFTLNTQVIYLNDQLTTDLENSLDAEIKVTYMISQFYSRVMELSIQQKSLEIELDKIRSKQRDDLMLLYNYADNEAKLSEENARLSMLMNSLKSELEVAVGEKQDLADYVKTNTAKWTEAEDIKSRSEAIEASITQDRDKYEDEIWQLKNQLTSFEEEVDILRASKDTLEVTDIMLRSKVSEHQLLLEECDLKLRMLEEQNNELNLKLSDQILKTEEFRSLSLHLKELKDKADAECHQAREKRESDGSLQESLRIAFIKEQYETNIQDIKNQLYVSKQYAEEMLLKLQNSLDEVEKGKKAEVCLVKKVEELSTRIIDLETELQKILTDKKEIIKSYDRMKAELECSLLSLDCCKEDKLKLEDSLKECSEEKTRVRVELDLVKRLLNNMASTEIISSHGNQEFDSQTTTSIGQILKDGSFGISSHQSMPNEMGCTSEENPGNSTGDGDKFLNIHNILNLHVLDMEQSIGMIEGSHLCSAPSPLNLEDTKNALGEDLLENNMDLPGLKNHFKEQQKLKDSMDRLQKELEKLRSENLSSVLPQEDHQTDPSFHGLERGLSQLNMANEQLGNIFPSFKDLPSSGTGNPLEKVLAWELELAEALQTKKSDFNVQSSFLKQHNDEGAIFQNFRDINELIQEMLELKNRYVIVESELKEMQGRYSQLSLQFAEVDGERQKLAMTLKNRVPKKS